MAQATGRWDTDADAVSDCHCDVNAVFDTYVNSDRNSKCNSFSYVYRNFDPAAYSNTEVEPGTAASTHAATAAVDTSAIQTVSLGLVSEGSLFA